MIPGNTIELRRQLQTALLGGNPPAAYQSVMGYELKTFVDAGQLQPIGDIWTKVDGVPYAIPLNMAIISNIFYNKKIFDENKLTPPKTFADLDALKLTSSPATIGKPTMFPRTGCPAH